MPIGAVVGVDGCKAGWFFFRQDREGLSYGIAKDFASLVAALPDHSRVFIDIPIGLISHGEAGRDCDSAARKLLGPRRSSIFSPPCRPVLAARDYDEARVISQRTIGKKLSKQSFFIMPKIKEVDEYLLQGSDRITVREMHPELAFWALNQRRPMEHSKKQAAGFEARLKLLQRYFGSARSLIDEVMLSYPRKQVLRDDIVDALVALVVAGAADDALQTVPGDVPYDSKGLAMEIVFTEHPNKVVL